jgi:hypothetical protein
MTHPDFGEGGRDRDEELTAEQVALIDLTRAVRVLSEELMIIKKDLMTLEEKLWKLES